MRILLFLILVGLFNLNAEKLKPYILGVTSEKEIDTLKNELEETLKSSGFNVLGEYVPANDNNRLLIVITSSELIAAVEEVGGLTGFAAALRIALTKEDGKINVSYTNPQYWGNAYFRDDFKKVNSNFAKLTSNLEKVMKEAGTFIGQPFGSEEGLDVDDIQDYQYMFGMPDFDDTVELEDFDSYETAIKKIDKSFFKGVLNVKKVYEIEIPGKELKLYGVALKGENGENSFLPKIDGKSPKATAFLPYEFLVKGKEVHMLHGRFRIALSFPDLSMGTFMKISSTPGDIEEMLESVVK